MIIAILLVSLGVYQYDTNFKIDTPEIKEEECLECDNILEEL